MKSKVITVVKEGENVQILETGKQKTTIGKYSDKWIKIKTKSGKTGFSFGAFIFDLNSLINKKWYLRTSSGEIFGFILKENFDFYIIKGDAEVEKDPVISKYGSFKIEGRKISFSKKFGGHSRKKINSLFLYRYKSKNVLLEKEYHIDDRSFLPPSGIPWGWWKGR